MPWTEDQAGLLREMGVHWVRRGAPASGELPPAPAAASPEPARADVAPAEPRQVAQPVPWAPVAPVSSAASARPDAPTQRQQGRSGTPPAPVPALPAAAPPWDDPSGRPDPSGMGWAELREAVAACQACGLCRTRTQTVFGVGCTRAEWLIVGEAPGEQEDRRGEPFVGAAGQLLDRMLAALGLDRSDAPLASPDDPAAGAHRVYIANTLKCRPPGNRNPEPGELAQCEPFLQRQVALLQPRIILAMGRFAVQSLLRSSEPIGKLRGRVHRYQGVPLVVTYHPAYLLRNPADKSKAWADLCLAASTHGGEAARGR